VAVDFRYDGAMVRPACVLLALALVGCDGSPPDVVLYANGNFGSWPLDSGPATKVTPLATGVATSAGNVAVTDDITGGVPSLQISSTDSLARVDMSSAPPLMLVDGVVKLSSYAGGSLQLDLRLEVGSDLTRLAFKGLPPLEVEIPITTLSSTAFTHLSIPFSPDLYGSDGPEDKRGGARVFSLELVTASPAQNKPLVTINDVRWTP
jgi:hypothetical protein